MSLAPALAPFVLPDHWKPSRSSRARARRVYLRHVICVCNSICSSLLFLSSTDSSSCTNPSPIHGDIRRSIFRRAARFCQTRRAPHAQRGQQLTATSASPHVPYVPPAASAVPIQADLIDLPLARPEARLLDLLPPHLAEQVTPQSIVRPSPEPCHASRGVAFGERAEFLALCRRLLDTGLVKPLAHEEVKERIGLFCVPKGDKLRLIADARRTNAAHRLPPRVRLPNPGFLASLEAHSFVSGTQDLSAYYSTLLLPDWLIPWFTLPRVFPHEAASLNLPCGTQLALAVVPMGWAWSVFLAQEAHQHILAAVRPPSSLLMSAEPHELHAPESMIYIDDHAVLAPPAAIGEAERLQTNAASAYAAAKLVENPRKRQHLSAEPVQVLGLSFRGAEGRVVPPEDDLADLVVHSLAVASQASVRPSVIRSVVGRWLWFGLLNRPFLSVFSAVFAFTQRYGDSDAPVDLWPRVALELRVAVGLAPLLAVDTRLPWCGAVVATDASDSGFGVALADAPASMCRKLAVSLPHPATHPEARGVDRSGLVASLPWRPVVSKPWARVHPSHITSGELFALTIGVRHAVAACRACDSRILLLTDNAAVLGAVQKGRSSAASLRSPMRVLAAWLLASGVRLEARYVPSASNPADEPSRAYG